MIPRRIWINLGAFFCLFLLLLNWAVRNVITLDQIERPVPRHRRLRELARPPGQRRRHLPRRAASAPSTGRPRGRRRAGRPRHRSRHAMLPEGLHRRRAAQVGGGRALRRPRGARGLRRRWPVHRPRRRIPHPHRAHTSCRCRTPTSSCRSTTCSPASRPTSSRSWCTSWPSASSGRGPTIRTHHRVDRRPHRHPRRAQPSCSTRSPTTSPSSPPPSPASRDALGARASTTSPLLTETLAASRADIETPADDGPRPRRPGGRAARRAVPQPLLHVLGHRRHPRLGRHRGEPRQPDRRPGRLGVGPRLLRLRHRATRRGRRRRLLPRRLLHLRRPGLEPAPPAYRDPAHPPDRAAAPHLPGRRRPRPRGRRRRFHRCRRRGHRRAVPGGGARRQRAAGARRRDVPGSVRPRPTATRASRSPRCCWPSGRRWRPSSSSPCGPGASWPPGGATMATPIPTQEDPEP